MQLQLHNTGKSSNYPSGWTNHDVKNIIYSVFIELKNRKGYSVFIELKIGKGALVLTLKLNIAFCVQEFLKVPFPCHKTCIY